MLERRTKLNSLIDRALKLLLPAALVIMTIMATRPAHALETQAEYAIVIDGETGTVLFEKNADQLMAPASMTKIMTADLVFERLMDGRLSLDDTVPISEDAWRKGGSKMFVRVGTRVSVEDLLRGIIIQSGNDASIAMAEAISGSEEAFGRLMTERARDIGMNDTVFKNATGWPHPEHLTTARDLATLALHTISNYPDYYHFYGETSFTYNEIKQANRNPLLYKDLGADGLKTGHTEESGYGLTASAKRGDRRIVLVLNGLPSTQARSEEAERLLDWAFREFDNFALYDSGAVVAEAATWLGSASSVPLVVDSDIVVTLPRAARKETRLFVRMAEPVPAPVTAGDELGELVIAAPDRPEITHPVYAGADVAALGFAGRVGASLKHIIFGTAESMFSTTN